MIDAVATTRAVAGPATKRDTTRDGLRNRIEVGLLTGLRPFWAFVNARPWLARFFNRLIVNNAVLKVPARPLALSTMTTYTSWPNLTDKTWFSRYLPPVRQDGLPPIDEVASLFKLRPERAPRESDRSTLLFPAFAQWFTDGFLMTDPDRRRTRTAHQIDLCQVYGLDRAVTTALRRNSQLAGEKGKLKSVKTPTGEWAPRLYDEAGNRHPDFVLLPQPVNLPANLPFERKETIFAFGGERANTTVLNAALTTLFLREHNRLCTVLESSNSSWDDERVFQTARNINVAQLIKVVVEEYINHISPYWFRLLADPKLCYKAIWNRENWIPVEFNLLYRWHSLVPEVASWGGAIVQLKDLRYNNRPLVDDGLVAAFENASRSKAWRIGLFNTASMLDVVERASIQQGRDNHLARYNEYRAVMKYPKITRFEQLSGDPLVVAELRRIYGDVDNLEYFVGLFAEDLSPRAAVPPLIGRMVAADAFSHALTNPLLSPHVFNEATFTAEGMRCIERTSALRDILARNDSLPDEAFVSMDQKGYDSLA
ncbi:peroxidase family protein [Methylobacterium oryzisoli]|uniref:peroxidase family protein n=1 Tax=Methylobacterium oryzisoli TaxID=3385502 RepID=UPI003892117A